MNEVMSSTKTPTPSEDRSRLQEEAIAKNAEIFRCVKQLQALTLLETGTNPAALHMALDYILDTAVALVEVMCGGDLDASRAILKKYNYPNLLD